MVCPAFCSSTWRIRGNQLKKTPYFCNTSDVKFESTNMDFHADLQLARRLSPHGNFKLWHWHLCATSSYDHLKILQRILLPLTLVTPKQVKSLQPVSLHSSADLTRKAQVWRKHSWEGKEPTCNVKKQQPQLQLTWCQDFQTSSYFELLHNEIHHASNLNQFATAQDWAQPLLVPPSCWPETQ